MAMPATESFDIVIIGGGPGGYVAAIRASQLGSSVAVVEHENMGGICLNWGCIPTKAILKSAEVRHTMENLDEYGLKLNGAIEVDMGAVMARSRKVASHLSTGIDQLMRKNKVRVVKGTASLGVARGAQREVVVADGPTLLAKDVILATGARAACPPHIKPDGKRILTYRDALLRAQIIGLVGRVQRAQSVTHFIAESLFDLNGFLRHLGPVAALKTSQTRQTQTSSQTRMKSRDF